MEFVCYTDCFQLPESANALFTKGEEDSVFFSRPWMENLISTTFNEEQLVLLACVVEQDCVLAILPLMKSTDENWYSLSNNYTSLYSLLLAETNQHAILSCLVQGLSQLQFQSLRLEPVDKNDRNIQSLQQAMESSGLYCHRYFLFFNWTHPVQGQSFDDYMATRPARVRNTIVRKSRMLKREHDYYFRLFIADDVQQALDDYNVIYKASWKANEPFGGFIQGLVERMSKSGWLRLAILYIEEQPVAGQIWFVINGRASIFRLAYDESWKQYSPGTILTSYLMEYVIDTDKVEEIDFLMGNERYKQDWMIERRERWGLDCVKKSETRSKVYQLYETLKRLLKKL